MVGVPVNAFAAGRLTMDPVRWIVILDKLEQLLKAMLEMDVIFGGSVILVSPVFAKVEPATVANATFVLRVAVVSLVQFWKIPV